MGASAALKQATTAVDPGSEASVEIRVKNTGSVVDQFTVEVLGDTSGWATPDPPTLSLFPDADGTARIVFRPPRDPSVPAGTMPFGVMVRSREDPNGSVVEEGAVQVGGFHEPSAELIPRTSRGSRTGRHELAVDNRGNVTLNAQVEGVDPDKLLRFELDPPALAVAPGSAGFAKVRVKPNETFWRGAPKTRPFQLLVRPDGMEPLSVAGSILQEAVLPSWFTRAVAALALLLVAVALLWLFVLQPQIRSSAEQALKDFGFTPVPGSSAADRGGGTGPSPTGAGTSPGGGPSSPTPIPVNPPPSGVQDPFGGRLDQKQSALKPGGTLYITDLVFSNPTGASGDLILQRDAERLLVLRLENFRDLDFHFVTPIVVKNGQTLSLVPNCTSTCDPSVFLSGYVQTP